MIYIIHHKNRFFLRANTNGTSSSRAAINANAMPDALNSNNTLYPASR